MNFKQYFELTQKPMNHLDVMSSELGIDPKYLKNQPQILTNFNFGNTAFDKVSYDVVDYVKKGNITTHVIIKVTPLAGDNRRKYQRISGQYASVPDDRQSRTMTIPIEDFNKMITQGLDGATQNAPM